MSNIDADELAAELATELDGEAEAAESGKDDSLIDRFITWVGGKL